MSLAHTSLGRARSCGLPVFMVTGQTLKLLGYNTLSVHVSVCVLLQFVPQFTQAPHPCDPWLSLELGIPTLPSFFFNIPFVFVGEKKTKKLLQSYKWFISLCCMFIMWPKTIQSPFVQMDYLIEAWSKTPGVSLWCQRLCQILFPKVGDFLIFFLISSTGITLYKTFIVLLSLRSFLVEACITVYWFKD